MMPDDYEYASATERLRELLDERGVKWSATTSAYDTVFTHWDMFNGYRVHAMDNDDGTLLLFNCCNLTPEQAVAATLGPGTCQADETETWVCECVGGQLTVHVMECSECGHTYEHVNGGYEFCPRCGRRIEARHEVRDEPLP